MSRTKLVALLALITLAVLLGSWFSSGWKSASSEAARLRETPARMAQQELSELAMSLASRLDRIRSSEDARPYYHYQNLFHDPTGLSAGQSIGPSPLARSTGDVLIEAHFQVDDTGRLTTPTINEELKQFSQQGKLADNETMLRKLRAAKNDLMSTPVLLASAATSSRTRNDAVMPSNDEEPEMQQQIQAPPLQQNFSNQAFAQNAAPNSVFRELEGKKSATASETTETAADEQVIEVLTHGFVWKAARIHERTELVALRQVETPVGTLRQGFVIGEEELRSWLGERSPGLSAVSLSRVPATEERVHSIPVPALEDWYLSTDSHSAQIAANAQAAGVHAAFLWRFAPTAALSVLLLALLVVTVSRAERLARERSQFAAAAAHELRTPLAGLQLYGDMLAEGLGDRSAKEKYARHISDEAQRLGRVVSNVLGFSQMERNGITLHCKDASLSDSARSVVERMRPALEQAGLSIELRIQEDVRALYDDDALSRILQNLLDNAEKYSRGHEDRCVRVEVEKNSDVAVVRVSDSGPGLNRQMGQQMFKPFRRNVDEDGPAGLGLGLALARSLAQQQGGELRAQEGPLGGASFVLELPLSQCD